MSESILLSLGIDPALPERRGLIAHEEARELEFVCLGLDGREHYLTPAAASAWRAMKHDAENAGLTLCIASSYRSIARQVEIIRARLDAGHPIDDILRSLAPPGYSEHHTGRAVDIVTPAHSELDAEFAATPEFAWLARHATRFDFVLSYPKGNASGYTYEPWHWCLRPSLPI
jgi:zinc D-Ala-D-Ala carboxypeptidase